VKFADFISNIEIQIWYRLSYGWNKGYSNLVKFASEHGHSRVTQTHQTTEGFKLGSWVTERRFSYRQGILSEEHKKELESLPRWTWDPIETAYQEGLEQLQDFVSQHQHVRVPRTRHVKGEFNLGTWVQTIRQFYKNGKLSEDRIADFESLPGWEWDPFGKKYQKGIDHLQSFVSKHDHSRVPASHQSQDDFNLGGWVGRLRQSYKNGKLSEEKITQLESYPSWAWSLETTKRDDKTEAEKQEYLMEYIQEYGHSKVPRPYETEDSFKLGRWISKLRSSHKNGKLSKDRINEFESLPGWTWKPFGTKYKDGLDHLNEFVSKHGHSRVPISHTTEDDFKLGRWVSTRRYEFKRGKLSEDRTRELESLPGWSWKPFGTKYEDGLDHLNEFVSKHGHSRVPASHQTKNQFSLGAWVSNRRGEYKSKKLSDDKIKELESFSGWVWKAR